MLEGDDAEGVVDDDGSEGSELVDDGDGESEGEDVVLESPSPGAGKAGDILAA